MKNSGDDYFDGPGQLLVRTGPGGARGRRFSLDGSALKLRPLCPNETSGRLTGIAGAQRWHVAELGQTAMTNRDLWDAAHRAAEVPALAGAVIEPDLVQRWNYTNPITSSAGLSAAPGDLCEFNQQDDTLPQGPGFAWHLGDTYTQLKVARDQLAANANRVRIGILDTGLDPNHVTLPKNTLLDLARNFVNDGRAANDVSDPYKRGLLNNPGHGTGTLGLLAGNKFANLFGGGAFNDYIGGAPDADILPIRIATSVILFRTSAFAEGLDYLIAPNGNTNDRVDVVSMSMGGLASQAWADVVNRAYEAGITIVTAAGNNYIVSPKEIVYPARFNRVIAACGVMADGLPYTREFVPPLAMAGNCGPKSKMQTALSAYTPNTSWAEINCQNLVDMDGAGTSSATPQIAAAAALWIQKNKPALAGLQPWQIVEAVRWALFSSAKQPPAKYADSIGRGILQAAAALKVKVKTDLPKTPADNADFALLKVLFGGPGIEMRGSPLLRLELAQVIQRSAALSKRYAEIVDSGNPLGDADQRWIVEQIGAQPDVSSYLKSALAIPIKNKYVSGGGSESFLPPILGVPATPLVRQLRGYAFDPQIAKDLDSVTVSETVYNVPWEPLRPGPCGQYVEVIDADPATGGYYQPANLDDPELLASMGYAPEEGNPQFHQQMVYAVAMRTIDNFEKALGHKVLWSPRMNGVDDSFFVERLRIYPHAFRERNAYYDPQRKALLFGYFPADRNQPGKLYPGGMVFTCLSHDIIAHETTHAILDGVHRSLLDATNGDVLAFHEGFSDIVAMLQHFTLPGILSSQIAKTRGNFRSENFMVQLAMQFGEATGHYGALRSAIGRINPTTRKWEAWEPDPNELDVTKESHARGAILVAAVFDAFIAIYERRSADLIRIATQGTGVLPTGELHPALVGRLADEAARVARHVLTMCVRALDYCPPVDLNFGDYLRAVITADAQVVPDDKYFYRVAFIEAFRRRGIYPKGLKTLSDHAQRWDRPSKLFSDTMKAPFATIRKRGEEIRYLQATENDSYRKVLFEALRDWRSATNRILTEVLKKCCKTELDEIMRVTGLDLTPGSSSFEVRSIQLSEKAAPTGTTEPVIIVSLIQRRRVSSAGAETFIFQGGCTMIADLLTGGVQYVVRKGFNNDERLRDEMKFRMDAAVTLYDTYFGKVSARDPSRRFAILHSDDFGGDHG